MIAAAVLTGLAGLVLGVLLGARVRVPPVLVGLFVTLPVVVAANVSLVLADSAALDAAGQVPMGLRPEIYAASMGASTASWVWSSLAIPGIGVLLLGCGVGAIRSSSKAFGLALFPILLGFALVSGLVRDRVLYFDSFAHSPGSLMVVPTLLVLVLLTAIGFVGTDSEKAEPATAGFEAAAAAGLGFLAATAALSIGTLGWSWGMVFDALSVVRPEMHPRMLANALGTVAPESGRGIASTTWAAAIALAGLGIGATASGVRRIGVLLAIPIALATPLLVGSSDPTARLLAFEAAQRDRFYADVSKDYQLAIGAPGLRADRVIRATSLRVTRRRILLDDEEVVALERIQDRTGMEISAMEEEGPATLTAALTEERNRWNEVGRGMDDERARTLVLQLDKRIRWSLLAAVLQAVDDAGYTELQFHLAEGNAIGARWAGDADLAGQPVVLLRPDAMQVIGTETPVPFSMDADETAVHKGLSDAHVAGGQVVLVPDDQVRWEQIVWWMDIARAMEPVSQRSSWDDPTPLFPDVWLGDARHLPTAPAPDPADEASPEERN